MTLYAKLTRKLISEGFTTMASEYMMGPPSNNQLPKGINPTEAKHRTKKRKKNKIARKSQKGRK